MIGALGVVVNVTLMSMLITYGINYIVAAVIAAEVTITSNFITVSYTHLTLPTT